MDEPRSYVGKRAETLGIVHGDDEDKMFITAEQCGRGMRNFLEVLKNMKKNTAKPILYYLVGLPCSGKSTYAHKLAEENPSIVICSSDAIRAELYGDESIQGDSKEVFNVLHKRVKEHLKNGTSVVYDATNVKSKARIAFLKSLNKIDCFKECIIMATPYEQCLENNKKRDRVVPEWVIKKMYKQWNTPYWFEGWDYITVEYTSDFMFSKINDWVEDNMDYCQDNPHHVMTLGEHCEKTFDNVSEHTYRAMHELKRSLTTHERIVYSSLACAAMIHDCGKNFTKTFANSKGEQTSVAHYYCHENVGAYDALFYENGFLIRGSNDVVMNADMLYVSILVNLHMRPYAWEKDNNEKLRLKYEKLWGEDLLRNVMILHEADKTAH